MTLLQTIAVAFSMFSAVPMPQFSWDRRNMRYALCAFPLVGVLIGLASWAAVWVSGALNLPGLLRGALLSLLPVLLTGGIHLDGYADTCDALASHADPARKQEILKDPHVGSFAVIRLCGHFLLTFALWTSIPWYLPVPILLSFCLSRTLSGLAVASFPMAKNTGLAHTFAEAADKKRVRTVLIVFDLALCAGMCLCGIGGALMALAAHLVFLCYFRMSRRQFGGLSGDLAGWFLVQAEKWMLIALTLWQFTEVLL
ncbi:MAG: adenosylcobinamide-GDP ribazoletransferase [Oscillospiraceae bacterium]|nr:adenosylcobinamide-GDP ribazoletransferase [Oscillospiraceae bacterium]